MLTLRPALPCDPGSWSSTWTTHANLDRLWRERMLAERAGCGKILPMATGERMLGVLGGMGPLASAQFMVRLTELTPVARDQDHIPTILWSDPRVPDRTRGREGGDDPLPWLLRGVRGLREAGCAAIAIPCNTAHGWYDEMSAAAGCPILHIVDAAAAELHRLGAAKGTIGIMGTEGTLAMGLYQNRLGGLGWDCVTPSPEQMRRLLTPAIAAVKAGRVAAAFSPLAEVARSLASRGAAAVVLGCTEIPLGIRAGPADALGVTLVDTIDALARTAIAWARG
jgi:aspartate racemase